MGNHEEVQHQRQLYPCHQKNFMTRPLVASSSTAAYETGFKQQLESEGDVFSHLPSSTFFCCFFFFFLERIMTYALEDHEGTVSIGGRTIINLHFAGDTDGLAGEEE